jgi:hypothetical protein
MDLSCYFVGYPTCLFNLHKLRDIPHAYYFHPMLGYPTSISFAELWDIPLLFWLLFYGISHTPVIHRFMGSIQCGISHTSTPLCVMGSHSNVPFSCGRSLRRMEGWDIPLDLRNEPVGHPTRMRDIPPDLRDIPCRLTRILASSGISHIHLLNNMAMKASSDQSPIKYIEIVVI